MDQSSQNAEVEQEFSQARVLLQDLLRSEEILEELDRDGSANMQQVYTHAATIFALIIQRLGGGLTLKQTVKKMILEHRDMLQKENRRVEQGSLSHNASAYDKARRNIPLATVENFCQLVCNQLASRSGGSLDGRRVYVVDGTTISLPPTRDLAQKFPPYHSKQSDSAWPIMNMLVAHELQSSCCLVPEIGAMYGSKNSGEIKLFKQMLASKMPENSLVMGDSGFGVFASAYHCRKNGHQFVFALTAQRFRSHLKTAKCIDQGDGYRTYEQVWKPSPKERKKHPEIPEGTELYVLIHELELENGRSIYVVTDTRYDALSIGELYKRRYDGEFDIRDLKVTMNVENMRARHTDTIMKELYGSVIAYNLVVQFRREAARHRGLEPRRLSFSDTWLDFEYGLLRKTATSHEQWQLLYADALESASRRVLPDRRGKRSFPRVAHRRTPKETKFEKKNRAEAAIIREEKRRSILE